MLTKLLTYETREYSMFKKIAGNRNISKHNVNKIIKNIRENGLKPTIVIVNENMEVIDGQHRIEALKKLNLPVYYQVHKGLTLADCIAMNTSVKAWENRDYVFSYAEAGYEEFKELIRLHELFPNFTHTAIACICNNKSLSSSGTALRNPDFELQLKGDVAEYKLDYMNNLIGKLHISGRKECLITVLARVIDMSCINKERMQEQMENYGQQLLNNIVDHKSTLSSIEDLYNFRRSKKVRFISKYYEYYEDNIKG